MRALIFSCLTACSIGFQISTLNAQSETYLNGYQETIEGEVISYHAPDPRARTALLIRSLDSTRLIRWKTAPVPSGYRHETVSFVWLFGMDASPDQQEFTLFVDDLDLIRFNNPVLAAMNEVVFQGNSGSSLKFRTTKIDQHKDPMGYAVLTIPASGISPGNPLHLQVTGSDAGSNIWYMTFQLPVENSMDIRPQPLLLERNGTKQQALLIEMVNLDKEKKVTINGKNLPEGIYTIKPGYNALQYFVPEVKKEKTLSLSFKIDGESAILKSCSIKPVRPWTVYLVQHTHTDIGYTRPQSEILPEHLRFIDYALDFCDQTDDFPEDAKFRWTCESAWAVDQYLRRRSEKQISRLLDRIREGRVEVTAMPFNLSEIADETALKNMLHPLRRFRDLGIPVTTAMQDDVNGIGWCMADYFPDLGVNYLIMGEHGHRALIPFEMPTAFWWASPSGKRMLAFRAEHYMYGNFLLLHTGELQGFGDNLLRYLDGLEKKNYPFDQISLQYSGYVTDNSPPALTPNNLIREWNEKYVWPKLRSATAGEFMKFIENNHGEDLMVVQKAWPDWWTDGFGSAARETAAIREAQSEMNITTGLFSMAAFLGSALRNDLTRSIENIYDHIILYDEHTFGAAESISEPYSENSMKQWAEKSSYAWEAVKQSRILREEALGLLQDHLPRFDEPSISVFNTLNWPKSGPVELYIDHEILEPGLPFTIVDPEGNPVPAQAVSSRSDGTTWVLWVENIPALGYKTFRIKKETGGDHMTGKSPFKGEFKNSYCSVLVDPGTGAFSSLKFTRQNSEMVDPDAPWKPGQLIYERLSDRHQLELFTLHEEPRRTGLSEVIFHELEEGPVWTSIFLSGQIPECAMGSIDMEYRFYREEPLIELVYRMNKKPVLDPESLYVAFPVDTQDGGIFFDAQGGTVRPGMDQIPGTASDWNTVQNFVAVKYPKGQWLFSSPEIPLFHLGDLNLGNFSYDHIPSSSHLYSWVLNNYWTTNFRASQEGELTWRYFITLSEETGNISSTRFGWNSRIPLVGRVLPVGENPGKKESLNILSDAITGLLLVNSAPGQEGRSIILHLREIAGKYLQLDPAVLFESETGFTWREVDVLGMPLNHQNEKINIGPNSVHFIEIGWNQ